MENIIFSANVVLPLLILMVVGYFARSRKWIDKKNVSQCNALVFKAFLPVLLFNNVRASSIDDLSAVKLFTFVLIATVSVFILATLFVVCIEKENKKRGVMIQGIARSNYALFGIPLVTMLFPGEDVAVASILIAIVIPVFNIASVAVLTYFGAKNASVKNILLAIVKNPLIIGTFLGIILLSLDVSFPTAIESALTSIGSIATPFALFLLGASFEFKKIKHKIKEIIISVVGRLVVVPLVVLTIAVLLGFRDMELACIMVIVGSPTAVSSFTMAETMGGDAELASAIVVFTSTFCIITMFIAILIMKSFALI